MLVLSRNPGEWIRIDTDIWICLLGPSREGGQRIGVEAPPGVLIVRDELLDARERRGPLDLGLPHRRRPA